MEEVSFWRPLKTVISCDLFIIITIIIIILNIINFFRRVFSECTEAIIFPEECASIIGFLYCVDQSEILAGSIAYGAPFKFLPTHQYKDGKGVKGEKKMLGWLNASLKSTETRDML